MKTIRWHQSQLLGGTLVVIVALLGIVITSSSAQAGTSKISPDAPCGTNVTPHYKHVVWILLENVGYSVVGSSSAPYLNSLANACGLATNDRAVAHPSLPNYIALTSGSTQGITDDAEPSAHALSTPSLFSQLKGNWRSLVESMPSVCDHVTSGLYAARHNPAVYFTNLGSACQRNDVPLTYPLQLQAGFTLIVPNICDDMHSCSVATGDAWLRRFVPKILASSYYQQGSLALFITFDENDEQSSNRVPVIVVAPSVPSHSDSALAFTHYSLLRTTENLLNVPTLGAASHATSMIAPFHL
jgi:hypothetical protein